MNEFERFKVWITKNSWFTLQQEYIAKGNLLRIALLLPNGNIATVAIEDNKIKGIRIKSPEVYWKPQEDKKAK